MHNKKMKSIFWDINKSWSRKKLINIIVGSRNKGKTFGVKEKAIKLFLESGKKFVYIRRYQKEMKKAKTSFFADIIKEEKFPDLKFEVKGDYAYINDVLAGYFFTLSTQSNLKSVSLPEADFIIFDEFTIDPKERYKKYLPFEVEMFINLIETIIRMRDEGIYIYLLGNAFTWTNPYFMQLNIRKPYQRKWYETEFLYFELAESEDFNEAKSATRWGKFLKTTSMGEHIIENKFFRDNNDFIVKKAYEKMRYFFTLKASGKYYGVYMCAEDGVMYVSDNYDKNFSLIYVTILDNHEPNTMLLKGSKSPPFKRFIDEFKRGNVRFSSTHVKNVVYEVIKGGL